MINLYDILLESLDCARLIEEGKDPREVLHYKFSNVPSEIIDNVIEVDPTKKKSYSQWLLSKWDEEEDVIVNGLENGKISALFSFFKDNQDKQIKDYPSVKYGLEMYVADDDTVLGKSHEKKTWIENQHRYVDSDLANDFDIIFDEDDWVIAVPNTYEASGKLGENTRWCTTGCYGNDSYYKRYKRDYNGEYYVNFDKTTSETLHGKEYPYTRYQFHFESNQFMDADDEPISVEDIGIPQSAIDFYQNIDEDYVIGGKSDEQRYEEYYEWRCANGIRLTDDLELLVDFNDNYERVEINENTIFYLYDTSNDDRDPLCWKDFDCKEDIVKFNFDDELLVLEQSNVFYTIVYKSGWYYETLDDVDAYLTDERLPQFVMAVDGGKVKMFFGGDEEETIEKIGRPLDFFINEDCTSKANDLYALVIETIDEDDYHSLLGITNDDECDIIIRRDIPLEGKYFTLDENEIIRGEFKNYTLDEYNTIGDAVIKGTPYYHLEKKLENGSFVVSCECDCESCTSGFLTIIDGKTRQPLNFMFGAFVEELPSCYIVKTKDSFYFYTLEGKLIYGIRSDYKGVNSLKQYGIDNFVFLQKRIESYTVFGDVFDGETNKIIFKDVNISGHKPIHGELFISTSTLKYKEGFFFDTKSKEVIYKGYDDGLIRVFDDLFIGCFSQGNNEFFVPSIERVIANNVSEWQNEGLYVAYKTTNGLVNRVIGDLKFRETHGCAFKKFFDHDVKEITKEDADGVVGVDTDGTTFVQLKESETFDFRGLPTNKYEINIYKNTIEFFNDKKMVVSYSPRNKEFDYWGINGWASKSFEIHNPPQEIIDMANDIIRYVNVEVPQHSMVGESFKMMLNRMNNARKLLTNDKF